jgi:FlaA1/EpsC-like NDP-sugar epimerase
VFGKSVFKSYSGVINIAARIIDPLIVIIASLIAYASRFPDEQDALPEDYRMIVVVSALCVIAVFPLFGLYSSGAVLRL